jgi:hypothetical protein
MARTHRTARKSSNRLPVCQLAPQNVPQPQEHFEVEWVVPESPTAQDSLAEEQQQPKDPDIEDKANEEYPPPRDAKDEKMYRVADEVESFRSEAPVLAGRL